jgi:hypothetical protein
MSVATFDPEATMRRVRAAAAKAADPAKAANPLKSEGESSRLAGLAAPLGSRAGDTADAEALDLDVIEERAALAADHVPAVYLDVWARLNCQKPAPVSEAQWRLALDDGGRFLDACGSEAADLRWTPGELFEVTAGVVWRLAGESVGAIGANYIQLKDGRTIARGEKSKGFGSGGLKPKRSLSNG